MLEPTLRDRIREWCEVHMLCKNPLSPYPHYENTLHVSGEHLLIRMRVCLNDVGGDIVILSCNASYGANENNWQGTPLGLVKSIRQLNELYNWISERAE